MGFLMMNANELRHDLTLIEENGFGADADADSTIKEAAVAHLKLLELVESKQTTYEEWFDSFTGGSI